MTLNIIPQDSDQILKKELPDDDMLTQNLKRHSYFFDIDGFNDWTKIGYCQQMITDEHNRRILVNIFDANETIFYDIEHKKTIVRFNNTWPPLLYIVPSRVTSAGVQTKRRYVFQNKLSEHIFSCQIDFERAR